MQSVLASAPMQDHPPRAVSARHLAQQDGRLRGWDRSSAAPRANGGYGPITTDGFLRLHVSARASACRRTSFTASDARSGG